MADVHRVRTLLRYMSYGKLREDGILPEKPFFTRKDIPTGGKTPKLARKIGYPSYGLFVEGLIGLCLEHRDRSIEEICRLICGFHPQYASLILPEDYSEICTLVRNHFESLPRFQVEWSRGPVQGHPDVVYKDTVYDIKTTHSFDKMRSESILQILSYYCLAQLEYPGGQITKIGVILPTQRCILTVDLSEWNWEGFWDELKLCVTKKQQRENLYNYPPMIVDNFVRTMTNYVGNTVFKADLFEFLRQDTVLRNPRGKQFFVRGRSDSNVTVEDDFRNKLKSTLSAAAHNGVDIPVFIHSPYTLNIANPWGNDKRLEDSSKIPWTCERLISLLKFGEEVGIKGVVVHFGQHRQKTKKVTLKNGTKKEYPPMSFATAIVNMFCAVNIVAENVSGKCKLLLETPAGETGELCSDRDELISFFLSLPPATREKVELCVDTCHVLSAGYDPYEYIQETDRCGLKIGLFHYNDSYYPKGCRNDCHASISDGYVGLPALNGVLQYAIKNKIPCVYE
jgi:endonuclease IV